MTNATKTIAIKISVKTAPTASRVNSEASLATVNCKASFLYCSDNSASSALTFLLTSTELASFRLVIDKAMELLPFNRLISVAFF